MTTVAIPSWNAEGVIPPINDLNNQTNAERSPYTVSLLDFALRFNISLERRKVLQGFMEYRAKLHSAGLIQGFQWLDGSFLEDIETIAQRPPNDIDVVTFYHLPVGKSQQDVLDIDPSFFRLSIPQLKNQFHTDAYLVSLGISSERLIKEGTYWYSMWSHRRNQSWKGYVQVDLAPNEDTVVNQALAQSANQGVSL